MSRSIRRHRGGARARTSFVVALLVAGALALASSAAAVAAPGPGGCGYGQGGPLDTTLCWLDMSQVDIAAATSAAGAPVVVGLPGGNTISFTVLIRPGAAGWRPITPTALPTWGGTALGNAVYRGTPGKPVLYQDNGYSGAGENGVVTLTDIVARGPRGQPLSGYAFVMADGETTSVGEGLTFSSDRAIDVLASVEPPGYSAPCQGGLTGVGTTAVRCTGTGAASRPGNLIVTTTAPGSVSASFLNSSGGRQGLMFGVVTAKATLTKTISSPYRATDGFGIAIRDATGTTIESADTDGGPVATTGTVSLLADSQTSPFTFGETPNAGTDASLYRQSWSCIRNGSDDPALSGATTPSQLVPFAIGDDVDCTIENSGPRNSIALVKQAALDDRDGDGLAGVGETIRFTFTVSNTGNRTLTDVGVTDAKVSGVVCARTTLDPGQSTTCSATYTVTQADVDAGAVVNEATAQGTPPDGLPPVESSPSQTNTPTPNPDPAIAVVKRASLSDRDGNGVADVGETIAFSFEVTNTGNQTLTGIVVSDPRVTGITCPTTTLAPGASTVCSADLYTVTQADVDAAEVRNSATATGTPPDGQPPITSPPSQTNTPTTSPDPGIAVVKRASLNDRDGNGVADVGETIAFSFEVTNTGNQTLTGIVVSDPRVTGITCPTTTLAPGASTVCSADLYTVTQADVDADEVRNSATATGTPPGPQPPIVSPPSETNTPTTSPNPAIAVVKRAALDDVNGNERADVGETIRFTYVVSNTGNQTLRAIAVADPQVANLQCAATTLAPGQSTTCTADPYTVTQADVDRGEVLNLATARGTPPGATPPVESDPSRTNTPTSDADPRLSIVKQATLDDANGNGLADIGETITFTFEVVNVGNVRLDGVTVADRTAGAAVCAQTTLLPGERTLCVATTPHTVTQADVDEGAVRNLAVAIGTPPPRPGRSSPPTPVSSDPSRTTTPVPPAVPAIALLKHAAVVPPERAGGATVGDMIVYSFDVTNSGNVTLHDVAVADPVAGAVSCPSATLAPGATQRCVAERPYVVGAGDVAAGSVRNTATAAGSAPDRRPVGSQPSSTTTPVVAPPPPPPGAERQPAALRVAKSANVRRTRVGATIRYRVRVVNDGPGTARDVRVADVFSGSATVVSVRTTVGRCSGARPISCRLGDLGPHAAATITVRARATRAGRLGNRATASGRGDDGRAVRASDRTTVAVADGPALLRLSKTSDRRAVRAGETFRYRIAVRSSGRYPARDVRVCDTLPNGLALVASRGASHRAGRVCWRVALLRPGQQRRFEITVRATGGSRSRSVVNRIRASARNAPSRSASAPLVRIHPAVSRGGGVTG